MNDVEKLMGVEERPVDTERALARIRERVERERLRPVVHAPLRAPRSLGWAWTKGLAAAASVALFLTVLTVSGLADTILTIFEPKRVVAVPITSGDLASAEGLARFGALEWSTPPRPYDVPDVATAARETGLRVLTPARLPAGVVATSLRVGVMPKTTATFTFSAERTRQSAQRLGRTAPPMPANIDGSRLFITGGPAVVQHYGEPSPAGAPSATQFGGMPTLVIAQGRGPVVQSDGVTVEQLQQYLLAQPAITPQLAAQIRAIKDPSSTLPIPIPVDMATSKKVTVQGVEGVLIGDSTGLGSAVIWSKDGIVYGVGGTLSEADILAVANSLR